MPEHLLPKSAIGSVMRFVRLTLAAGLLAMPVVATAQTGTATTVCIEPQKLLSLQLADFNEDGILDRAVLSLMALDPSGTELYIYLSKPGEINSQTLAMHKKNIAWSGTLYGTLPSLEINQRGSLVIVSENQAVGRDRWQQELTVSLRDNEWKVSGYTYNSYDTLDPKNTFECDVNLLTGRAKVNGKAVELKDKGGVLLKSWSDKYIPGVCQQAS